MIQTMFKNIYKKIREWSPNCQAIKQSPFQMQVWFNTVMFFRAVAGSKNAFSIQLLPRSWNFTLAQAPRSDHRTRLRPNDDHLISDSILSCLDGIIRPSQATVFTRFSVSFTCNGCGQNKSLENFEGKPFRIAPLLHLTTGTRLVTPAQLLTDMLSTQVRLVQFCNSEDRES